LVKDIFSATKIVHPRKNGNPVSYPGDKPCEDQLEFLPSCKEVVTFFHNHHVFKAKLKAALESAKLRALVTNAQMQWETIQRLYQSLLYAENVLNSIVSEKGLVSGTTKQKEKRQEIKDILNAPDYQANLEHCLVIAKPIDKGIEFFHSYQAELFIVYEAFYELPGDFE
jgi:hypothetical protein